MNGVRTMLWRRIFFSVAVADHDGLCRELHSQQSFRGIALHAHRKPLLQSAVVG